MTREYPIEKTRNIGIIAHIDAGKTTVSERILFYTGRTYKIGEVHEGQAVMDWMDQERERGITITAAATTTFWPNKEDLAGGRRRELFLMDTADAQPFRINIIDTPGHIDFTAEVQRSLRVLDGAVVIFDGVAGVEPQSETVWHQADKFSVPRICFINKLDRPGADFNRSLQSILDRLSSNAIAIQLPVGSENDFRGIIDLFSMKAVLYQDDLGRQATEVDIPDDLKDHAKKWRLKMVEKIAETDEALLDKYLAGQELANLELKIALRQATVSFRLVPVLCGSALKNKGIQLLLDAIVDFLPNPLDIPAVAGVDPRSKQEISRQAKDDEPLAALAFKIATDPFVGTLTFFRVYAGTLAAGTTLLNSTRQQKERIGRIVRMHSNQREDVSSLFAGDIAAAVGLKTVVTGDTLCDVNQPIVLESISFPEPVIAMAIEPNTKSDQEKMGLALARLMREDPTLRLSTNPETGQSIIAGMGELHLEIIVDRLKREFGVQAMTGRPQVAYKETIKSSATAEGKYIRQTGGRGQYGHVMIEIEPLERGLGFEFVDKIKGGIIPAEYIPAVEKGIKNSMVRGVLAGYPLVDVRVILTDGSYHDVDSSELAFSIAGSIAFQEAARKAGLILLEPIMKTEIIIGNEFFGDIMGDLGSRRGRIIKTDERGPSRIISATVPLAEMFGYATNLRSMTQGRGAFNMEFDRLEEVPSNITQKIIEGRVAKRS